MHCKNSRKVILWYWGTISLFVIKSPVYARPIISSLLTKTTAAEVVIEGEILRSSSAGLSIKVGEVIKGLVPSSEIQIEVPPQNNELSSHNWGIGDRVIVFISLGNDGHYRLVNGHQGLIRLTPETGGSHLEAIKWAKNLSETSNDQIKAATLEKMLLSNNEIAQREAITQILLARSAQIKSDPQIANGLFQLAKSSKDSLAVPAIQTLGSISPPQSIQLLFQLIDTSTSLKSQVISQSLEQSARKAGLSTPHPDKANGSISKTRWQQWWHENKRHVQN